MEDISIDEAHYMAELRRKEDKRIAAIAGNLNDQHKARRNENYFFQAMFNGAEELNRVCLLYEGRKLELNEMHLKGELFKYATGNRSHLDYGVTQMYRFGLFLDYYIRIVKRKAKKLQALCVEIDEAAVEAFQELFCYDDDREEIKKEILYLEKLFKK